MSVTAVPPLLAALAVVALGWSWRPAGTARLPLASRVPAAPPAWSWRLDRRGRVIAAVAASLVIGLVSPMLAVVVIAIVGVRSVARRRARSRLTARRVVDELPEVVDLLSLAVSAGLTVPLALRVVAERGTGHVARDLGRALDGAERGGSLADALDALVLDLGDDIRPLVRVLAGSLRDGSPLAPALQRLGDEVRLDRRRAAEERARQLSVRLLFPLVVCVLPAFGLLTVVPLLAGSLAGIEW